MRLSDKEKTVLAGLVQTLRTEFRAEEVILYGSASRDAMDVESDIDLLVILPAVNWEIQKRISHVCFDAQLDAGRVFSTLCVTRHELVETPFRATPFVANLHREGVRL